MLVVLIGTAVLFVGGGARFAIGLTLKPMEAELAGGRSLIGLSVAVFQAVSAVSMFVAGRLADRIDLKAVLGIGLLAAGVGMGLMSTIGAAWQVVALYGVVFGIGSGLASLIPVGVMIQRFAPERASLASSVAIAGNGLGQLVLMAALTPALEALGWRAIYVALGLLFVLLAPVVWSVIAKAERARAANTLATAAAAVPGLSIREAARTRQFWLLLAVYSLCGLQDFFVATHVVAFAQDSGASATFAGNLLAAMGLMMVAGVLWAGWASERIGPVAVTAISFVLRVAIFTLVLVSPTTFNVALFALVFGATFLMTAPLLVVFVREAFGVRNLGALTGLITMIHHIWGGIGAWAGAAVFDWEGSYTGMLWLLLATSAAGAVLSPALRRGPVETP